MQVAVSFLTNQRSYRAELPSEFSLDPHALGVWSYEGDRHIGYIPASRFDLSWELESLEHVFDIDRGGVKVSAYRRSYEPPLFSALWHLESGFLQTFVTDPIPTADGMSTVIMAIQVQVDAVPGSQVPRLTLEQPLSRPDPTTPELVDTLGLVPADGARWWPYLEFKQTVGGSGGTAGTRTVGDAAIASTTAVTDLVVSCTGPVNAKSRLAALSEEIAGSVKATG